MRLNAGLFLSLLLTAPWTAAAGQLGDRRTVRIQVADTSGKAIGDVRISVRETGTTVRSDSNGIAILTDVPRSSLMLSVRRLGFQADSVVLRADSSELHVTLQPRAQPLAGVETRAVPGGFADRRARGVGIFFTPTQIAHSRAQVPSDLFVGMRFARLTRVYDGYGVRFLTPQGNTPMSKNQFGKPKECVPMVYLDGRSEPGVEVDDLYMDEILAVEIYETPARTPPQFPRGAAAGCGTIVIWTNH